jgi:hypothetical protein
MALQLSETMRNNQAAQFEATIGTAPKLQIRSGAPPANCGTADSGTLLCEITLPSDWLGAATAGVVALIGTWTGTAVAAGTAGHFRIKDSAGSVTGAQGTITATGGGGDMTVNNVSIASTQEVTVSSFSYTRGNA